MTKGGQSEEDVLELQEDLTGLYEWANTNSMIFKETKFQLVRYETYETDETKEVIERFEELKNLGVIMKDDGTFDAHIEHVVKKVRRKTEWVLRTFYCRRQEFMKTLYKSIIVLHVDYCSQLWMPTKNTQIHSYINT